jgi:hypothetical protein
LDIGDSFVVISYVILRRVLCAPKNLWDKAKRFLAPALSEVEGALGMTNLE